MKTTVLTQHLRRFGCGFVKPKPAGPFHAKGLRFRLSRVCMRNRQQAAGAFPQTNAERRWRYRSERRLLVGERHDQSAGKEASGGIHRGVEWVLGLFRWLAWPFLVLVMLEQPPVLFKLI